MGTYQMCQVNVKRTDVFANGCSCEQMFGRIPITASEQKNGDPITATERKNGDLPSKERRGWTKIFITRQL